MTQAPSIGRRVLNTFIVMGGAICVYSVRQVDPDLFGYLDYGRVFLQHRSPIVADPFAYTSGGFQWVSFEYLSQVLLWLAYHRLGPIGLIGLKCLLGGLALLYLWRAVRATTDDPIVCVPVFLLCASTASRYFLFRPQLFTFACFALYVALLFRFLLRGGARLWVLPIVMLIWVNTHGGFLAGLGAIGLAILIVVGRNARATGRSVSIFAGTRPLLLALAACLIVTLINPWGPRLWAYVLTEIAHDTNRRYITEWQPLSWHRNPWSFIALTTIGLTLVTAGAIARKQTARIAGLSAWAWVVSGLPLIVMAFVSARHVPLAAIWTAPLIARLASELKPASATSAIRTGWLLFSVCALVPLLLIVQIVAASPAPRIATGGTVLGSRHPCRAVAFIRERELAGNLYNPLWWGAYITWHAYPAIRVSMDGRNISLFPDEMVEENLRFYSQEVRAADLDAPLRYQTDLLLVPSDSRVVPLIQSDSRWQPIYADSDALLFVRADAERRNAIVASINARRSAPLPHACPQVLN